MKPSLHRSTKHARFLLAIPITVGTVAPALQADIIYTPVNGGSGLTVNSTDEIFFSPVDQDFSTNAFPGANLRFDFYEGEPTAPVIQSEDGVSKLAAYYAADTYYHANKLSAGAVISGSYNFPSYGYLHYASLGPWNLGDRAYVGLRLPGFNYGWADVSYNLDSTLTLYGFAYDDSGAPILAGAVPEPATNALIAALAAGSAAAFAARRKRKLAKAA